MKCSYPDCDGEVTPGDEYCYECGRSLSPVALQAALTGMQALNTPLADPVPVPTGSAVVIPRPPLESLSPMITVRPTPGEPLRVLVFAAVGFFLFLLCAAGALTLLPAFGLLATPPDQGRIVVDDSFDFALAMLGEANGWAMKHAISATEQSSVGEITIRRGASYGIQGAGDKIVTLFIAENNRDVLELAASDDSDYEGISEKWLVLEQGQSIIRALPSGLTLELTPSTVTIERAPRLPTGLPGSQPIFTSLALQVRVSGAVAP